MFRPKTRKRPDNESEVEGQVLRNTECEKTRATQIKDRGEPEKDWSEKVEMSGRLKVVKDCKGMK